MRNKNLLTILCCITLFPCLMSCEIFNGLSSGSNSNSSNPSNSKESSELSTSESNLSESTVPLTETVPITVWTDSEKEATVITSIVSEWNKNHSKEYKFDLTYEIYGARDCGLALSKDPSRNDAPALFLCTDDYVVELARKHIISKLSDKATEMVLSQNNNFSIDCVKVDDNIYGFPFSSDCETLLWYNKLAVDEQTVWSLEYLLEYANKNGKKVVMDLENSTISGLFIMSPQACGTDSLKWDESSYNDKLIESNWAGETGVKVSEYIGALLSKYYKNGTLINDSMINHLELFESGTAIATIGNAAAGMNFSDAIGSFNVGVDKLPEYHIDGKAYQMTSFGESKSYLINKTSTVEEQRTALALGELISSKEAQLKRFETANIIPTNLEALEDVRFKYKATDVQIAKAKQIKHSTIMSRVAKGQYFEIVGSIGKAYLDPKNLNGKSWAEFLKELINKLKN